MSNPTLIKTFTAGGAITKRRLLKMGASDTAVVQSAAAADSTIGVAGEPDAASGARIDVTVAGIAEVEYGGNVTRGDRLTSDANGKAVAWSSGAAGIIGQALKSGASGDIGVVLISQYTED